ncbi:uncharacterized protein LOC120391396 isoform X4 [Mauremys reevesii]|uniref:uncharacterized protein LOC120391396 isoform X4 n=1 Tax=Mauremys reevesii TaxID=260615 RepID=UPI00193ED949|nr:uncharacterized protein LOC120391396 isoform X4 [Mauremys reevesii]
MAQQELYGNWLCPPPSPGKRLVRQTGIYLLAGGPAHGSHFRSDSPDSFSNEEDYDDVSLTEVGDQMQKRLPAYKDNTDVASHRSKEGTGVYVLAGKPASSSLPRTANPVPDSNQGIGYRPKSIVTLYVLMGICFAMWAVLLSLAVVKCSSNRGSSSTHASNTTLPLNVKWAGAILEHGGWRWGSASRNSRQIPAPVIHLSGPLQEKNLEMSEELKVLNYNHSERLMNVVQDLADARIERKRILSDMNKSYKELSDLTAFGIRENQAIRVRRKTVSA